MIRGSGRTAAAAAIAAFTVALIPAPVTSSPMSYRTLLQATMTVKTGGIVSIARATVPNGPSTAGGIMVTSDGGVGAYMLFFDQGLNATGTQRNFRSDGGLVAYDLCQDPACVSAWASGADGDAGTPIIVTSGNTTTAVPLYTVIRHANTAKSGAYSDVVTLTMYF